MSSQPVFAQVLGPLDAERSELVARVIEGLDAPSLQWLSGFAAGIAYERAQGGRGAVAAGAPSPVAAPRSESQARLAIVYGSQTGNGKRIAERLGHAAEAAGLAVRVQSTRDYPIKDLAKERLLVLLLSTHGDGDPPDDARGFIEYLAGKRAPKLEQLQYSVLALGDSSYPKFCETGRQVDERLAALGARRLLPRVECDLDFERLTAPWLEQVVGGARDALGAPAVATVTRLRTVPAEPTYTREQPFAAPVLANQRITGRGATKDVRHVELSLEGSGLGYEPGDALGVWHENPPLVVEQVLAAVGLAGAEPVTADGQSKPLAEWLATGRELTRLTRPFLLQHSERAQDPTLAAVLEPGNAAQLRHVLRDQQLADLLRRYPASWDATALVQALRPLAPRLYSIASSREAVGDEAHLTVAVIDYESGGERRLGAASGHLAALDGDEARARIFIEPNERFRLPADGSRDVIMVGPGTGVAPYRGFLQHREAQGARGRNWLLFGARHFASEFLYQVEWQEAQRKGLLNRLDLAFSRDRTPRVYVQHKMREHGRELFAWLEAGAYLYVCGDAERMAPDVDDALTAIAALHGGLAPDAAAAWVRQLADERRYLRDVY